MMNNKEIEVLQGLIEQQQLTIEIVKIQHDIIEHLHTEIETLKKLYLVSSRH